MSERMMHVKRVVTIEYTLPTSYYPNMTDDEIRAWESDVAVEGLINDITDESVEVTFDEPV